MPTLLETQQAVYHSLIDSDDHAAADQIVGGGLPPLLRLDVHRNTFLGALTAALRLSFPAICQLVGADFFETAARIFIERSPPHSAYLDDYGSEFPRFLAEFAPAVSLPYLADVAHLEWAVSRAFHAPDVRPLVPDLLSNVDEEKRGSLVFSVDPSVGLVHAAFPIDDIWRTVLSQDDAGMAAIDLAAGPVWLLVERKEGTVDVIRLDESQWHFFAALYSGCRLGDAIDSGIGADAARALADHLIAGRFTGAKVDSEEYGNHIGRPSDDI